MKLGLQTNLTTKQTITPKLQHAIKILQLSAIELKQEIQNIFESNPLIEKIDSCDDYDSEECSIHFAHYEYEKLGKSYQDVNTTPITEIIEKTLIDEHNLKSHLSWQVELSNLSGNEHEIALTIIDYINDDGYLINSIETIYEDIYKDSDINIDEMIAVQHYIQNLDPVGTATSDIQESIQVQINNIEPQSKDTELAIVIVKEFFNEFINKKYEKITKSLNINIEHIQKIDELIKKQNPRPGSLIKGSKSGNEYIIPDIKIYKNKEEWQIQVNRDITPKININKSYVNLKGKEISEVDKEYLSKNLQEAKWFIKNLEYRNSSLIDLAKSILKFQISFFEDGKKNIKPLTLRKVAEDIDVHESTVSRLTNGKYIDTPFGIFELKYFFSSRIDDETNTGLSANSTKEMIKEIIKSEDSSSPYSDEKIRLILIEKNINVARRTITKYRESIGLSSSSARKITTK